MQQLNFKQFINNYSALCYEIRPTENPKIFKYRDEYGQLFIAEVIDYTHIRIHPVLEYTTPKKTTIDLGDNKYKSERYFFGIDPAKEMAPITYDHGQGTLFINDQPVMDFTESFFSPISLSKSLINFTKETTKLSTLSTTFTINFDVEPENTATLFKDAESITLEDTQQTNLPIRVRYGREIPSLREELFHSTAQILAEETERQISQLFTSELSNARSRRDGGILREGFISCDPEGAPEVVVPLPDSNIIPVENIINEVTINTNGFANPERSEETIIVEREYPVLSREEGIPYRPREDTGGIATERILVLDDGRRVAINENGFANPERRIERGIVSEDTRNLLRITETSNEFVVPLPNGEEITMVALNIQQGVATLRDDWEVRMETDTNTYSTAIEEDHTELYQETQHELINTMAQHFNRSTEDLVMSYWREEGPKTYNIRETIDNLVKKLAYAKYIGSIENAKRKPRLLMLIGS